MKAKGLIEESMTTLGTAVPDLEFTGERLVPGKTGEALFREHEERYVFAGQHVSGKDVLDVACGTGVGTAFLREAGAPKVWGLDIDPDTIAFAKARYAECEFAQSNATALCLPNGSVDVVVSFETLEHLQDQRKFLLECRRVLRPGGMLICSTPNVAVYRWYGTNPFHVREHTTHEFVSLLSDYFVDVSLFSQSERVYPLFVLRRVVSRFLDRLKLTGQIRSVLGMNVPPQAMRGKFSRNKVNLTRDIRPDKGTWMKQATYMIAICRKNFD